VHLRGEVAAAVRVSVLVGLWMLAVLAGVLAMVVPMMMLLAWQCKA
jgi:hypothetical protein